MAYVWYKGRASKPNNIVTEILPSMVMMMVWILTIDRMLQIQPAQTWSGREKEKIKI